MPDARIRAVITAEDRASAVVSGFGASFGKMTSAVAAGMVVFEGIKRVIGGVIDIFTDSIRAFIQAENAQMRLRGAIKNVTSATDKNVDALLDQAEALQQVTRFSDDQIVSAQGVLATFQLNQSAIEKLTPRLIDLSEGLARADGVMPDLEGNAILVAKALGGEDITGLSGALRRVGVIMTSYQEQVLKTGTMQERLAIITKVLDQNVGGLGTVMGETASAKFIQLQNAVNDLQEQLGAALFTAIRPFIADITNWAKSDRAREVMKQLADRIVEFGQKAYTFIKENWEPTIKPALQSFAAISWSIVQAIGAISNAITKIPKPPAWLLKINELNPLNPLTQLKALGGKIPGFAGGVSNFSGGMAVVGERGPELVNLPRGSSVTPNDQLGSTINLNVNIGMFAGTAMERRKIAQTLLDDMKDIASSKGMTLDRLVA